MANRASGVQNPPTSELTNSGSARAETGHEELTERQFRVPIKDHHGHSDRISFRCHPQYIPVLNNILRSERFPFRSTNDIVRYAVDHVCRDLERRAGIPSMMHRIDAIRELLIDDENNASFLGNFELIGRRVQDYINTGAPQEAARILTETRHHIDQMPEGYWKSRYRQELLSRFGHLLQVEAGKGASLTDGDEG